MLISYARVKLKNLKNIHVRIYIIIIVCIFAVGNVSAKHLNIKVVMVVFIGKNEDFNTHCPGVFVPIPIVRLVCRSISRFLCKKRSRCDEEVLLEFISCVHSILETYDSDSND